LLLLLGSNQRSSVRIHTAQEEDIYEAVVAR
jgi:hypothetical protein